MRFIYTKTFAALAAAIVIVALLAILQIKGLLSPVRTAFLEVPRPAISFVRSLSTPVVGFFSTIYRLHQITQENAVLSTQILQLQQQLADFNQSETENEALRNELGFVTSSQLNLQPCSVLAENPENVSDTLVLDCGTSQGVAVGQALISQGYLVGKIISVTGGSSTALLITDSNFLADALISQTSATGIIRGSFGSGLILDRLSQDDEVQKGWLVVTAGINQQIPKNILIGQVGDIISNPNSLFKQATVISPIDFSNLQFTFVVK